MGRAWQKVLAGLILALASGQWGIQQAAAQWAPYHRQPVRSVDRWLGIGYSEGYHWRNPGPNSDYYSPYSDLNAGFQNDLPGQWYEPAPAVLPVEEAAPTFQPQGLWKWSRPGATSQQPAAISAADAKHAGSVPGAWPLPRWAERRTSNLPGTNALRR